MFYGLNCPGNSQCVSFRAARNRDNELDPTQFPNCDVSLLDYFPFLFFFLSHRVIETDGTVDQLSFTVWLFEGKYK